LPGQVYQDRTGEGGTQPNNDIANFSIAEPQDMPGKLVFVINNAQPNLVQNGNSLFYVYFDPPTGGIRYRLRYSTNPAAPVNEIGTGKDGDFIDDPTPELGGQFRNWTIIGTLEPGSGIQPDGSVRFIVNKATLGINNGDVLLGVAVREDTANSPSGVIAADYAGGRQDYLVVGNNVCAGPPLLTGVVSRKAHGSAGNLNINVPLVGTRGVECRAAGHLPDGATGDHQLVFTFATPLSSVASVTVSAHNPANATGFVSTSMIDPANHFNYIVNLTNVSNAQYLTVTLNGVTAAGAVTANVVGPQVGVLLGDVTGNGVVTNTDVGSVKAQVDPTTPVSQEHARADVSANGFVTNTDVGATKGQVNPTSGLPSPP
jgi:Dockerin type I domain